MTASRPSVAVAGTRVRLVPFAAGMISDEYLGWLNDPKLMRYSKQRFRQHSPETALAYLRGFEGTLDHFWSVQRLDDLRPVGTMTAYVDPHDGVADVGVLIGAQGQGLGGEAWGLATDFLLRHDAMRKVTGGTVAANRAMVRIFARWRMTLEGVLRAQELVDGDSCDVMLFGVMRYEWEANFPKPLARVAPLETDAASAGAQRR